MAVYLIHLDPPYKHARHYCGFAEDVKKRFTLHIIGRGARLTQVAVEAGCELKLAKVWWDEGRDFERKLKDGSLADHCPLCRAGAIARRVELKRLRRAEARQKKAA
jgi:hypothetical protein